MTLQHEQPERFRMVLPDYLPDRENVAQGLGHFFLVNFYKTIVNPIVCRNLASSRLGLGNFVFMMGKNQVLTASMNIKRLPQIAPAHGGAFDVPARSSLSPWTFPERFAFLALFPKDKIQRISFLVVDVHARTGHHLVQTSPGQSSVIRKISDGKKHIAVRHIGKSFFNKRRDQTDHVRHMLSGPGCQRWRRNIKRRHILIVEPDIPLGNFRNSNTFSVGAVDDFIVNVREIFHVSHLVAASPKMAEHDIKNHGGTGMADMADIISRNAANIHTNFVFANRMHNFFLSGFGVENFLRHDFPAFFQGYRERAGTPQSSGREQTRFMFCTACPAAPLIKLSIAERMMTRLVRGSRTRPISQ